MTNLQIVAVAFSLFGRTVLTLVLCLYFGIFIH